MARTFDPIQLGSIELFCKAAELGSFAAAAEALGVTPAAVSRSIGRLEARLAVRLFVRTTRRVKLTADGELYHAECQRALEQIANAERAITDNQRDPSGLLRISAPTTYGHYRLIPLVARFCEAFPKVEVELDISNHNVNFVDEGFDVVIRRGDLPDSRLIARSLEVVRLGLYAAPAYLARRGTPTSLTDLTQHECIQFVLPSSGRPVSWRLRDADGQDVEFAFRGRHRVRGDLLGCVNLARAGMGICHIYEFVVEEAIARGELIEILPSTSGRSQPFSLLYPPNLHLPARVRAFIDFMADAVRRE
ncbi:LysR family transcriptional regulator [Burkholderia sp. AU31652]|uniref:LysR family transcriptional regulator n=1 Tax=Burkholderia sp. AU31652 TaxID=2015354 RepID=UPI000B7AB916|nr:LysR family transcriptional regulator [Burkholderia sp. AU31652]OXI78263.1 LysR family transcriptional regulator [Burkholderia sp. AU31652]